MNPQTLNCPMCGAVADRDAVRCSYCEARLATVACPSCFSMIFFGSRHCPYCGAKAASIEKGDAVARQCPRCSVDMRSITVGGSTLLECVKCNGLWVDTTSLEKICNDRAEQSALLGAAAPVHVSAQGVAVSNNVKYVPCPECKQLMNRVNFARCSGVIVDICKAHGTWFDRDELRGIVEFIRAGGLENSRLREKEDLNEARQKLRADQLAFDAPTTSFGKTRAYEDAQHRHGAVAAAGGLLKMLVR